jgi:hypothetical protein
MQKLRETEREGGKGENFISKLKEEFNLTKISGLGSVGPSSSSSSSSSSRGSSSTKSNEKEVILELPGRTLDDAMMRHKEEEGEGGGREGESASSGRQVPRRAFVPS